MLNYFEETKIIFVFFITFLVPVNVACRTLLWQLSWYPTITVKLLQLTWRSDIGLTHLPLVLHMCVCESGQHWFRQWLVPWSAPSHYLNQRWNIGNWTRGNKLQWNFNQNTEIFIHKNASEYIVCEMAVILFKGRWFNRCCNELT